MASTDPLAALDDSVVDAVAADHGLAPATLLDALRQHQEYARSLPGVEELVYDWRRALPYDPVVHRDRTAYYLVFRQSVWTEFAEQLGFDEATLAAVQTVHDRQCRNALADAGEEESVLDGGAAMVLTR